MHSLSRPIITLHTIATSHLWSLALPSATPTASTTNPPSPITLDPAIWAALIGLVGVLIASGLAFYQFRRTAQLEKKRQEEQLHYEEERQKEQFRHEEEMERLRKELEKQSKAEERQEQEEANKAEVVRLKMVLAQTTTERANAYRQSLKADPRIVGIQILDMTRPLDVMHIYVKVRVHQEARTSYLLDPTVQAAEKRHDPNALLQMSTRYLERRTSSAIDPEEALRTYKRCVFVGDPGAGKTTLLKYLTIRAAECQLDKLPNVPIRIELNAFAASGYQDLLDFAAADWDERYGFPKADARVYIHDQLQAGSALLLLDALDETVVGETPEAADTSYQRVADAILHLASRYEKAPIVVTARKAGYHQHASLVGFTELEILDFRQKTSNNSSLTGSPAILTHKSRPTVATSSRSLGKIPACKHLQPTRFYSR
jgi:predicted NACHT family NTPase